MKPSFFGKCYGCWDKTKEKKEIVTCHSWASQNGIRGGFINWCAPCGNAFGIPTNRMFTVKKLSELPAKVDYSKYKRCVKCKRYFLKIKSNHAECLICFGRKKDAEEEK